MKTVLIVEDHADVRALIRATLEIGDFEIHEAPDGRRGLAQAQRLRPDIVLLDVMMPGGIDGLQVCREIRADPALRPAKVVMLTARYQAQDRKAAADAGADHYIAKPFDPAHLLDTVSWLLR